jgi:formate dehydrogenase subunit gamma
MTHRTWTPEDVIEIVLNASPKEGALLPVLHAVNRRFGYVPDEAVPIIASALNLSRADVHGVVTFYHDFRREPPPPHTLKLCRAEACQARGADALAARTEANLADRKDIGVEAVYCLGLCASGPAALIDGRPVARLDDHRLSTLLAELDA